MDRGTYTERDGRPTVRFQHRYPHPVERLWAAVTEPGELAHWFPSTVRIEPRAGGTIAFSDDPHVEPSSGTVLMFDPPHRLAFTWGDDERHFELSPVGDSSCELTLVNVLQARDTAARNAVRTSPHDGRHRRHGRPRRADPADQAGRRWEVSRAVPAVARQARVPRMSHGLLTSLRTVW
jgi:uncharacterized protein YndB with AHSA1/START domain